MTIEIIRLWLRRQRELTDAGAPQHSLPADAMLGDDIPAGSFVVEPQLPGETLLARAGGGWRVAADLFWSLLDPLTPTDLQNDDDPAPSRRRLWQRLDWWRELPQVERTAVAGLLDRCARGGGDLVTALDRLAASGSPFGEVSAVLDPEPTASPFEPLSTDPAALAAFLTDPAGLGTRYGEEFVPREQQAEMAAAVARALTAGQALLAEAGTGTGKTLAYLAPLVARLAAGEDRAVIATYSRALQSQILDGDLPLLLDAEGDFTARLLMGRSNYLCLRQRRAYLTRPLDDGGNTALNAARLAALRMWLQATTEGVRDELVRHPLLAFDLGELFAGVQPCTPDCWEHAGCFVIRARRKARQARLVVVNHALLLSDHDAESALIGPFRDLVVDEAHRLPQSVLDARTVRLDRRRLADLEELLGATRTQGKLPETPALLAVKLREHPDGIRAGEAADELGRAAGRCQRAYGAWWRKVGRELAPGAYADTGQRLRVPDKDLAFRPLATATAELLEAAAQASTCAATLNRRTESLDELSPATVDLLLRCAQAGQLLSQLERDVRFVTADPSDRWVTWLESGPRGTVRALGATPLEAGPLLRELWQDRHLAPIATSATLAVGEDFGFMLDELGLTGRRPRTSTLAVSSPFDWAQQTVCLAPEDMPAPDAPDFADAVVEVLAGLREEVGRQTLALFTSYRLLQTAAEGLRDRESAGELLVQTPRSGTSELRDRFRRLRGATLLGTSTFWEGVDFPGQSLEVLVVTKLPFRVPSDPWVQARCEHLRATGQDPFSDFMVRDAVLRLRQGVGRLIRRRSDRGVVVLLDNRLINRRYGATFLAALPAPVRWLPHRRALAGAVREILERTRREVTRCCKLDSSPSRYRRPILWTCCWSTSASSALFTDRRPITPVHGVAKLWRTSVRWRARRWPSAVARWWQPGRSPPCGRSFSERRECLTP